MKKLYLYNTNTHTLHINNFCKDAKGVGLIEFDSENSAIKYYGRSLRMCEKCTEKREEILRVYIKQKEG